MEWTPTHNDLAFSEQKDEIQNYKYKAYNLKNFRNIPQIALLTEEQKKHIEVVGNILPFKANNYVVDELIDWNNFENDPMFILTFPQKNMISKEHYERMAQTLESTNDRNTIKQVANEIRLDLNPHPAGQLEHNVPVLNGTRLTGIQHKYHQTALFFPSQGQTCHAYCTFCFRWPQFTGMDEYKFAMKETELLVEYVRQHPELNDVLFTGGDPLIMKARFLGNYIDALLEADLPNLRTIRIGSKALSYWPYRFINDDDSEELLNIFERVAKAGKHLAIMGHFNHTVELQTPAVQEAIRRIRATGAQIRTQSPIMKNINDDADTWRDMWKEQVKQGCIPYYMFLARDTGAQDYFSIPLEKAWMIFKKAYEQVSGIGRTVRGPSMSCEPGKVQILGVSEVAGEKVFVLRMIQGRNPDWALRPFFAKYDPKAVWLDDLKPAFGEQEFFYEKELQEMFAKDHAEASVEA